MAGSWLLRVRALSALAVVFATLGVIGPVEHSAGALTMPAGFVLRDTPTGQGLYNLTDFGYLPDGSVLTIGKTGRVTWVPQGGAPSTIAVLDTDPTGDLGLIGMAIANDYDRTGHIYLIRSIPVAAPPWRLRLSRFTVVGGATPTALEDETVLFEISSTASMHGMTSVVPAPDGTLWVSVGDLQFAGSVFPDAVKALDLNEPAGKLLHLTADGAGVPSNPYYDAAAPSSWRSRTYASGFRSPFRFSLNPGTGVPIIGDVGWRTWEELDLVEPGQSYKWPCWEGPVKTAGYGDLPACANVLNTPPLWYYHHGSGSTEGNSVVAGIVYSGQSYPERYRGAFFFGDYTGRKLWTTRFDAAGTIVVPPEDPPFGVDIGAPVKFAAAPNGDIVYADLLSGSLRRLSYTPGNTAPLARVDTTTDPERRTVTFDAGRSVDFDGDALTYRWTFGDGATAQGRTVSHTYTSPGDSFIAGLTVTDPLGASDTVSVVVAPSNHTPVLDLATPGAATFAVGDPVSLSASATDTEDGPLPVHWTVAILHCSEATTCHLHPENESTGGSWQGLFPDHAQSSLQITATVEDSVGVVVSKTYVARPRLHQLLLVSDVPAVLQVPGISAGAAAQVTEGLTVDVTAAAVANDGVATFSGWADGPATRTRSVTMGTRDITLTARYLTPIGRRFADEPALQSLLGSPTGPEVAEGGIRYRPHERGRLYWSPTAGVHEVHGAVLARFLLRGGHAALGVPVTDEKGTADGVGRFNDFSTATSIYFTPRTGAHLVRNEVRTRWRQLGAERGVLGYPVTDYRRTAVRRARFVDFQNGGSVYWSSRTGAHEVYGPIWRRWTAMGRERSTLGLPTTGVQKVPGGLRSVFQLGVIRWYSATGKTVVRLT